MRLADTQQAMADIARKVTTDYPPEHQSFMHYLMAENAFIDRENRQYVEGWRYPNYLELLLDLGRLKTQDYFIPDEPPFTCPEEQQCFLNAYHAVLEYPRRYTYVEGKASGGGLVVNHAWVEDQDGRIIDPTWGNFLERDATPTYYGIRFHPDFVFRRALDTGWVSILNREWAYKPDFPALRFGFKVDENGLVCDYDT